MKTKTTPPASLKKLQEKQAPQDESPLTKPEKTRKDIANDKKRNRLVSKDNDLI